MIDTFYRIKSLHECGIQIHLHCFEYGREESEVLTSLCKSVNYYPRKKGIINNLSVSPFNVLSRKSNSLLRNLSNDNHPILFDGLHTTYYLDHPALSGRKKFVRAHNIEHRYYQSLAKNESNIIKKFYFLAESFKLKLYEKKLRIPDTILAISITDQEYFSSRYRKTELLFPFVPFSNVISKPGTGDYIVYHGNLAIKENSEICKILIEEVFSRLPFECIITGKGPSDRLLSKASDYNNISIISDPDEEKMLDLIMNAHINLLPVKTCNGFRVKLLYALFAGRHCLVNNMMVTGTNLNSLCHIAEDSQMLAEKINILMKQQFSVDMISERNRILRENFNNTYNAENLIRLLF